MMAVFGVFVQEILRFSCGAKTDCRVVSVVAKQLSENISLDTR